MNYLIQRGKVRSQVINVPEGLPELLSDITREVLRCQPTTECLCQFIIDYLHSVLVTREKARVAKSIIDRALHMVDEIIEDMCICDISKAKADQLSATMESCFRRFLEKRRCEARTEKEIVKFHEEDMLDELIKRCKFTDYELKMTRPMIEEAYNRFVQAYLTAAEGTDGTEALYQYFKKREIKRLEEEKLQLAAVKIQSRFRGFIVRRSMFLDEKPPEPEVLVYDAEQEKAALKIQKYYRKHRVSHLDGADGDVKELKDDECEPGSQVAIDTKKAVETAEETKEAAAPEAPAPTAAQPAEPAEEPPAEEAVQESTQESEAIAEPEPAVEPTVVEPTPEAEAEPEPEPLPEPPAEEPPVEEPPPAEEPAPVAEEPPAEEAPAEAAE